MNVLARRGKLRNMSETYPCPLFTPPPPTLAHTPAWPSSIVGAGTIAAAEALTSTIA